MGNKKRRNSPYQHGTGMLNYKGFIEVKINLEIMMIILNTKQTDAQKLKLLKRHIEKTIDDFETENGHLEQ